MAVKIKPCNSINCKSDYQDEKYGKGNRAHNESGTKKGVSKCTVCGTKS